MIYANGDHQVFTYDNDFKLLTRQIANQAASPSPTPTPSPIYQKFKYDGRNRKTEMWWGPNSTPTDSTDKTWANNIVEHNVYQYDLASRLTQASNAFSTVKRL